MYSICGIVQCISLVLLSTQPIFSEIIRFNDGEITYEYDNSCTPLGIGIYGTVFEGIRTEGNQTESVAFKELNEKHEKLLMESNISAILGQHDSFPTFYRYFPETNETSAVFVMERIGRTLNDLWNEFSPFSAITVMQIGLQILDVVEWMHANGITHNDLHSGNIAVGYHNNSKIYLFDFSLAEMNKNKPTRDLTSVSHTLNLIIQPVIWHEVDRCHPKDIEYIQILLHSDKPYQPNNALQLFDQIAKRYRRIKDGAFRKKTFENLRSILMRELESHKHDADYDKYTDIGYIQGFKKDVNNLREAQKLNL